MEKTTVSSVQKTMRALIREVATRDDITTARNLAVETIRELDDVESYKLDRALRLVLEQRSKEGLLKVLRSMESSLSPNN